MSLPQLISASGASQAPLHISGGVFNHAEGNIHQHVHLAPEKEPQTGFQHLQRYYVNGDALYNSEQRFPPPKCHPQTRVAVQEAVQSWAMSDSDWEEAPNVLWLYGPAGAGKSAIAQTMAERWSASGDLAAAFFFARWRNGGGDGAKLFPTLAYQFALRSPDLRRLIGHAIEDDPGICVKTLEEQARVLIRDRFLELSCDYPMPHLVVIDGLDECNSKVVQTRILTIIFEILSATGLPHRFLICSRPELHIREAFDSLLASGRSYRHLVLDNTFDPDCDIRLYLTASFAELRDRLPAFLDWPSQQNLDLLVQKASGQFIYAATVLKFVDDEYSDPQERLRLILNVNPSSDEGSISAFIDLDLLYRMILSTNPNIALVKRILGAYFVLSTPNIIFNVDLLCISFLDDILGLPMGTTRRALRGIHSLFFIPSNDYAKITPYHASLHDFLFNYTRSREFFLDSEHHHRHLMECCLKIILSYFKSTNRHYSLRLDSAYSHQSWYNHFMDTSAHVNILTSFLGQLQDFLTPQEFSNYAIIEMRIENIINFLNTLFLVLPKLEPGQLRVSYLVNARKRLVNTLLLTVFDPTSESRQFYDMWSSLHFSEHSVGLRPCPKVIHIQSTLGTVMRALISGPTDPLSYLRKGALKTMHGDLEEFFRSNKSNADISARAAKVALELLLYRTTEINDRLRTCKHCQSLHAFHVERPKRKWSFASHWCRMLVKAPHVPALYDRLLELAETTFVVWPEELDEDHVESLIDWLKHFGDSARLIAAVQDCHLRFREYDERSIWRIFRLPPVDAPTATDMDY